MQKDQDTKEKSKSVKVAIRVRPMISKELADAEDTCIKSQGKDTLILGKDREFRFNRVFDQKSRQEDVFIQCAEQLVESLLEGYNSTMLAYGQTGSGKTFTMGTNLGYAATEQQLGILPRVIRRLFEEIQSKKTTVSFTIKASFLEIYNEQIMDLLVSDARNLKNRLPPSIIEENGSINILGLTDESVTSTIELMSILQKGSIQRSTAQTLMNDSSSRSHAIFSITVRQDLITDQEQNKGSISSKFHFVDLAGSERLKKTGATGSTLRQGISINLGLLSLGNVINALTNVQNKNHFIPYRDSKLTRILQDSLGGNSNTYMLACISPAQSNYQQSLSTLKYAARAMNIKNKPVVNRDPQSALISQLKGRVYELQKDNQKYRGMLRDAGIKVQEPTKQQSSNIPLFHTGMSMQDKQEMFKLKQEHKAYERKIQQQNADLLLDRKKLNELQIQVLQMKRDRDLLRMHLDEICQSNPNISMPDITIKTNTLQEYAQQIQQLRISLSDKERLASSLQNSYETLQKSTKHDQQIILNQNKQIYKLKRQIIDLYKLRSKYEKNQSHQVSRISHDTSQIQDMSRITLTDNIGDTTVQDQDLQQILDDGQVRQKQNEMIKMNNSATQQLNQMNKVIVQKQQELRQMTNNQIDLQYRLITQMKQQYYNKIKILQIQKQKLQKQISRQKDDNSNNNRSISNPSKDKVVSSLKAKRDLLQNQLKEYKKKEKEQQNLQKLVSSQKSKINNLSNQLKVFKQEKLNLNKKIKEDKEKFQKFKITRMKQILNIKKKNIQKDYEIRKLTNENKKVLQNMVRKQQEAKRLKKANDTLKEILEPKNRVVSTKSHIRSTVGGNVSQETVIDSSMIQYQIVANRILTFIACDIDLETEINKLENQIQSIEDQLWKYNEKQARIRLDYQRITMKEEVEENKKIEQEIKLQETIGILENLQQNLQYSRGKQKDLMQERRFDLDSELLYNKSYQSIEVLRKFLKVFLAKTASIIQEQIRGKQLISQLKSEIQRNQAMIEQKQQQMHMINAQHQQSLYKLREQLLFRTYAPDDIQPQQTQRYLNKNSFDNKQGEKKAYEKKIQDLNKKIKQLGLQLDQSKRRYDVVFQKYQSVKKLSAKDKFIGRNRQQQEVKLTTFKEKRMEKMGNTSQTQIAQLNTQNMEEVTSLMNNNSSYIRNQDISIRSDRLGDDIQSGNIFDENTFAEKFQWQCVSRLEGHSNPILSMACHSNMLISTSTKSLKLWDLQTNKVISDLSGIHLNGFVRHVVVEPERRIMITCCDKNVTLWDLVSLQVIGTLKGHKDQVRVLHVKDHLYSGGKGTSSGGGIFTWDFRSSNFMYESERNQDVFSFASNEQTLFYGSRNHQVRRLNISNMQGLAPFQPPHFDTVTCMTQMGGYLISGSKDKNLKLWDLQAPINNLKNTSYAHNDYVNCIQVMMQLPIFYSGSRNGQVKVGTISDQKINFLANIDCHAQSINTLTVFEDNSQSMFATGSSDKLIKIWRPSKDTLQLFNSRQEFQE